MTDVHALMDDFLLSYNPSTRSAYRRDLAAFTDYCGLVGINPMAACRRDLERYVRSLQEGSAPKTVARRLSTLSGFFSYCVEEEELATSPMRLVRRPRARQQTQKLGLSQDEARILLEAAGEDALRSHLVVLVLLTLGLRVSELVGADMSDISQLRSHRVLQVHRKGGATQVLPIPPAVVAVLDAYASGRSVGPVVLSRSGLRLDRSGVGRLIKRLGRQALPHRPDLSPHTLRHGFVSLGLDAGVPLREMQDGAGHASPATTRAYDDARLALERHPGNAVLDYVQAAQAAP